MSIRHGIRSARSYLTILIGFMVGFAIVLWVEQQMPKRVETAEGIVLSKDFPALPATRALTLDEALWARVAWQYFVNNTQPNGLVNAEASQPWFSLWSTGSYLLASISAYQLHIISRSEFDDRILSALETLGTLPLLENGHPATYYHAETLTPLTRSSDNSGSAIDMGRLMIPLQILLWRYPEHALAVQQLLSKWHLDDLIAASGPQNTNLPVTRWVMRADESRSSYGYRLYASSMLRTINTASGLAVTQPPDGLKMIEIDSIMVPDEGLRTPWGKQPSLVTLPYVLTGLEQGFDARSGEIAWRIMQILQKRSQYEDQSVTINTDYAEQAPDYTTSQPDSQPLTRTATENAVEPDTNPAARALLSTRGAFGWYALFRNNWSNAMRQHMLPMLEPGQGWKSGYNIDGSVNPKIEADTNAVILESLNYITSGQLLCLGCLSRASAADTDNAQEGVTPE